jgi:hypothetical protein
VTRDGLRISNVTEADNGVYTCRAEVESDGRFDERKISVVVHSQYIKQYIQEIYVTVGYSLYTVIVTLVGQLVVTSVEADII